METEFDLYIDWLEVQMELEELERKFFEELKGIRNADKSTVNQERVFGAGRSVGGLQGMAGGGATNTYSES